MDELSHFNQQNRPQMVDISEKRITDRTALAKTSLRMNEQTLQRIHEGKISKGDVLTVAQIAGIMGAKNTSQLIPMCHPLPLSKIDIRFSDNNKDLLFIEAVVKTSHQTGVEMEALTACTIAALTVYDMCKAIDKTMIIEESYLVQKAGGKSGPFTHPKNN